MKATGNHQGSAHVTQSWHRANQYPANHWLFAVSIQCLVNKLDCSEHTRPCTEEQIASNQPHHPGCNACKESSANNTLFTRLFHIGPPPFFQLNFTLASFLGISLATCFLLV
eukprot:m.115010 g.115010  ORF g.115010 m.115010 type:complete len:112 (-) comp13551_c0_seq1:243-578(-)